MGQLEEKKNGGVEEVREKNGRSTKRFGEGGDGWGFSTKNKKIKVAMSKAKEYM